MRLSIIRGGTSRAVFLHLRDLPALPADRDELCLRLIGSPDPLAIDGLGGGVSSNSKVMFVGLPAEHPDCPPSVDLVSVFAQVSPTEPHVDWSGNCGNISAAISTFAVHHGLLSPRETVRVWNANTDSIFELSHSGERIDVRFLAPGTLGPRVILPDSGLEASLVDIANPIAMLRAADVGVDTCATPAALNADEELLDRLEEIRQEAAGLMGLDGPVLPRLALLGEGDPLPVLMTSVGRVHHALPATGILGIGGALALGGTIADRPPSTETVLRHPKGTVTVSASVVDGELEWVALARSARLIMDGEGF